MSETARGKPDLAHESKTSEGQYTLDEMVRALKEGERSKDDQGELVTLEDGSVVRRVKRRKRRSDQSKKKKKEARNKRMIIFQILGFVGFLMLIVVYLGFLFFRSNSSSYREDIEKNVANWLGAEVKINGLSVAPSSATVNSVDFTWGGESYVKEVKMVQIAADTRVKDFLLGKFQGIDIGGKSGVLKLQMPESKGQVVQPLDHNQYPYPFDLYYCDSLAVNFGDTDTFSLKNLNASYRYLTGSGHQATISGGTLLLEGWAPFPIENATLSLQKEAINVVGLRLQDPDLRGGELMLSGLVPLENNAEYHLNITTEEFSMHSLLGENLGRLFEGRVRTQLGVVAFKQGDAKPQSMAIPLTGDLMSVKKLPFLSVLDELFPEEGFLDPVFDNNGSAIFQWNRQGVGLKSIKFRQSSKMLLAGHILASHDGLLVGDLVIRLNKGILARQPIFRNNPGLISDENDTGYAVVRIKLGGTVEEPTDNFRRVIGIDNSLTPAPSEKANGDFESLFKELTE